MSVRDSTAFIPQKSYFSFYAAYPRSSYGRTGRAAWCDIPEARTCWQSDHTGHLFPCYKENERTRLPTDKRSQNIIIFPHRNMSVFLWGLLFLMGHIWGKHCYRELLSNILKTTYFKHFPCFFYTCKPTISPFLRSHYKRNHWRIPMVFYFLNLPIFLRNFINISVFCHIGFIFPYYNDFNI